MPGWDQLSKSEEERLNRGADERIKNSPSHARLAHLCFEEITNYPGLKLVSKHANWKGSDYLVYYYKAPSANWAEVKTFYKDYFVEHGWSVQREDDVSWGSDTLEFRNDAFRVVINHQGLGDADYAITCGNLPLSSE
jgi:hypothetical protein